MCYICMTQIKSLSLFEGQDARYIGYDKFELSSVNLIEFKPFFQITTQWYSGSISPLSKTDDVVHKKVLFLDSFKRVC